MTFVITNRWDLDALMIQRMFGMPEEWRVCSVRVLDRNRLGLGVIFEGGIPSTFKSGPRKGKKKWPPASQCQTFTVLTAEMNAFYENWEAESHSCYECLGTGKIARRLPIRDENDFRTCARCNGTGHAKMTTHLT